MANTYTSTAKVRLYDQRSAGILLHPETELAAVQVSSGGVLHIEGNSAWVSASDIIGIVDSSGYIKEPLLEYTSGGTVTNSGTSTGYGTLLNSITLTTNVRTPATSASNELVPTEKAVANALDKKQTTLIAGGFISLVGDGAGHEVIAVSATTEIRSGAAALDTVVPTEKAVQQAVITGDINGSNYASSLVSGLHTEINESAFAQSAWVLQNFWQKGETPTSSGAGEWSYATYTSAGVVMPVSGGGLVIGASGALSIDPTVVLKAGTGLGRSAGTSGGVNDTLYLKAATTTSRGGIVVPTNKGLSLTNDSLGLAFAPVYPNYTSADAGYIGGVKVLGAIDSSIDVHSGSAYVPNVFAVYSYGRDLITEAVVSADTVISGATTWVQENFVTTANNWGSAAYTSLGVVKINSQGLSVAAGSLSLNSATNASLGGVIVPASSGITVASGSIGLAGAYVLDTYTAAHNKVTSGFLGGVAMMSAVTSASIDTYKTEAIVPTTDAVWSYGSSVSSAVSSSVMSAVVSSELPTLSAALVDSFTYNGEFAIHYTNDRPYDHYGYTISGGTIYAAGTTAAIATYVGSSIIPGHNTGIYNADDQTLWLKIYDDEGTVSCTLEGGWTFNSKATSIPIARVSSGFVDQYQHGPIVLAGWPGSVAGQGDGGAPVYDGEFAVTYVSDGTYSVAGGMAYQDGVNTSGTWSTSNVSPGAFNNLWLKITKVSSNLTVEVTSARTTDAYCTPLAKVNGATITQYQHGPVIVTGRWA